MAFVSAAFITFLLLTMVLYFSVPLKHRWIVLLAASYAFFWINSQWLLLVMLAATLITFFDAKWVYAIIQKGKAELREKKDALSPEDRKQLKEKNKKKARRALTAGVLLDLGFLLFLKYFNFFAQSANKLLPAAHLQIPALHLLLPLGISFYTLQAIAYLVDVYRGKCEPDQSLPRFMLFMSFFPQIVQGPIPRYNQLAQQLYEGHRYDSTRMAKGAMLMMWGFMKKMLIADRVAIPADLIFNNSAQYTGSIVFLGAALYGLQVYTDFSGGMDIARGIAQIFGIDLEINFRQPYFATSIEDLWRRWHITLGGWMRDYIFYPLSLSKAFSRLGKLARTIFGDFFGKRLPSFLAMFIVYFLVGFWHGPNMKYIAFGIWNGFYIVMGILLTERYAKMRMLLRIDENTVSWHLFRILRTFVICTYGRFFSRAADLPTALSMIRSTFVNWHDKSFWVSGALLKLGLDNGNWIFLLISVLFLLFVGYMHEKDFSFRDELLKQHIVVRWLVIYCAVFILIIFGIYGPGYDSAAFIYEQF